MLSKGSGQFTRQVSKALRAARGQGDLHAGARKTAAQRRSQARTDTDDYGDLRCGHLSSPCTTDALTVGGEPRRRCPGQGRKTSVMADPKAAQPTMLHTGDLPATLGCFLPSD